MTSIVEVIQHYQRSIDSSQDNEARLLHCINKLYKIPIKVEHLQETGVGKTVNSLRKFNGEIGVAAKTLVTKWKAMVAAEEEPMDTTSQTNESETHDNNNDDDNEDGGGGGDATPQGDEDDENHNRHNMSPEEKNKHPSVHKDKHKEKHKERSSSSNGHKGSKHTSSSSSSHHNTDKSSKNSNDKHKSSSSSSKDKEDNHKSSSSSSRDKEREKEKTEHKSSKDKHREKNHDKDRDRSEKRKDETHKTTVKEADIESSTSNSSHQKSGSSSKTKHDDKHRSSTKEKDKERSDKHKSSSKDKERSKEEKSSSSKDKSEQKSSSKSSTKDSDSAERKRRHNSDNDSNDFKSPQPKVAKVQKSSSSSSSSKYEPKPETQEGEEDDTAVADDSFDSSMGANFNDILGMLDVPVKKSKKSLKSPLSTPGSASSNSSTKKDITPNRPTTSTSTANTPTKVNGVRTPFSASSTYSTPSTSKAATMKPDLLAPTAKLAPLDPSIVLDLPTISTNYKPMPLNQTVMDCVFNTSSRPARTLTDAQAITHGISSKTQRTKIYSGVRTGQTFQVPSLFDMCIRILQKNIDALEYTGGVPFEVLRPVLDRATPQQLYNFEEYNPYLMEDSDGLWQVHVSRNHRTKKREENESWREMYIRCQEEEEHKLSILKNNIKASQKIATAPIRKTQLAFVDSMVKPPRNVQRKQEQYGTKAKLVATPAARVASLQSVTPNAAKTGDTRLRVAAGIRDHAHNSNSSIRAKKAPLMQKTLQFMRRKR